MMERWMCFGVQRDLVEDEDEEEGNMVESERWCEVSN